MAYTKIFPIRTRLDRRVRYALNGKKTALETAAGYALDAAKTESVLFTDAFNCGLTAPCTEMYATKRRWGKDQNRVQGYHIILPSAYEQALNTMWLCGWALSRCVPMTVSYRPARNRRTNSQPISCACSGVTSPGRKDWMM